MAMKKSKISEECPQRAPDVVFRENVDGTVAIMKLDRDDCYFTLNLIAAKCWTRFNGKTPINAIVEDVGREIPGQSAALQKCLVSLIKELKDERLLLDREA